MATLAQIITHFGYKAREYCYYYAGGRLLSFTRGKIQNNGIAAYWCNETNFGDQITPFLLRHYGYTPIYSRPQDAKLAATGSILEHLPDEYDGCIIGSGFLDPANHRTFPNATILSVRGKLTRQHLGRGTEVKLGDPGLLAAKTMKNRAQKKFLMGIVPHYVEQKLPHFMKLKKYLHETEVTFINVRKNPAEVFAEIDQCECIISSSLHGLIVADSLGIPNAWIASGKLCGGRFKFDDYYSSIETQIEPISISGEEQLTELIAKTTLKPNEPIEAAKITLDVLWQSFRSTNIHLIQH